MKGDNVEQTLETVDGFRNSNDMSRVVDRGIRVVGNDDGSTYTAKIEKCESLLLESRVERVSIELTFTSGNLFESGSYFRVDRILSHDEDDGHTIECSSKMSARDIRPV